jgi:hypothetical protein
MLWGSWAPGDGAVLGGIELTNAPVTVTLAHPVTQFPAAGT